MSYLTQSTIATNTAMVNRVTQCATTEEVPNAVGWTNEHAREWGAAPGWADAWEYAMNTHSGDPDYDPGMDEAVITDAMILSQVQAMVPPPSIPEQQEEST
jgi:hypothetical protein